MPTLHVTDTTGPTHPHDCGHCIPLGSIEAVPGLTPPAAATEDLYACPKRDESFELLHRYGPQDEYGVMSTADLGKVDAGFFATDTGRLYAEIDRRLGAHLAARRTLTGGALAAS